MSRIVSLQQRTYRCTVCRTVVGKRPEGAETAYCTACDRISPVVVVVGRR